MFTEIKELLEKVEHFKQGGKDAKENVLPSAAYYLSNEELICFERKDGDGRFPYAYDGLTLWAYSSGTFKAEESMYNIFHYAKESKEPTLLFFVGQKTEEGYMPTSLTCQARQPQEKGVERFVIYSKQAAYYFAVTEAFIGVLRATVNDKKQMCFTLFVQNKGEKFEGYTSAYFNPVMSDMQYEDFEAKWYKRCSADEQGYFFSHTEYLSRELCLNHYLSIAREQKGEGAFTSSKSNFVGNDLINCAPALFNGKFDREIHYTEFTETAIAGDIVKFALDKGEYFEISYIVTSANDEAAVKAEKESGVSTAAIDEYIERKAQSAKADEIAQNFYMNFQNGEVLNAELFNKFLNNVKYQVEFCSKSKNYAGAYIGIRDIFQQVEASLMWMPQFCRYKIVDALNYIDEGGRPPRQYSYPASKGVPPKMDLRAYIDQGVWIISTVYSYLCFTGDYSILDEECGYYKFKDTVVELSDKKSSVLRHLLDVMGFLLSNVDEETGCLKALYGDWNDALDGLGKTQKVGQAFGNGVSVMASLQLYRNCEEMTEILNRLEGYEAEVALYTKFRKTLKEGLEKHAIVEKDGLRKVLHGWGDDKSFFVGSFSDNDGKNRNGLTANAFWILSGMYKNDRGMVEDILSAYDALDSKYGLMTFEPYFALDNTKVGRISHLPQGTAENGATYIHATVFAIYSLFMVGQAKRAWEQIYKILPITHDFISTTPFVMPNSYIRNEEKNFDGQSMSDWFTGSGCVLMKALVKGAFGIEPTLDGVKICPATELPFEKSRMDILLKGARIHLEISADAKEFYLNGKRVESRLDEDRKSRYIFLTNEQLKSSMEIKYL